MVISAAPMGLPWVLSQAIDDGPHSVPVPLALALKSWTGYLLFGQKRLAGAASDNAAQAASIEFFRRFFFIWVIIGVGGFCFLLRRLFFLLDGC